MMSTPQPQVENLVNNSDTQIAEAITIYKRGKKGYPNAL
jgi:hypothetical protein